MLKLGMRRFALGATAALTLAAPAHANPATGQIVGFFTMPGGETNYTRQAPFDWTSIFSIQYEKRFDQTLIHCTFMIDVETEDPHSVYAGLWVNGQNLASGAHAGALATDSGIPGLVVITFSNLIGDSGRGPLNIDVMVSAVGTQVVTFQRKNWGIQCYEEWLPPKSAVKVLDEPPSPIPETRPSLDWRQSTMPN